jgi:hypothetical protein
VPNALPAELKVNRKAVHTEDHPLEYIDFHGEIPKGEYGGGSMTIWDEGTYETLKWEERKIEVELRGRRGLADGTYALFHTGPDAKDWMIHRMGEPADPDREPFPERHRADAGLARHAARRGRRAVGLRDQVGRRARDGVLRAGRLRFESRNLRDITGSYPELSKFNRALSHHEAVSTARSSPSTRTAGRRSGACSGACTSRRERRAAPGQDGPGRLRRLRPALARRPLAAAPSLSRARARLTSSASTGRRGRARAVVGQRRRAARGPAPPRAS